MRGCSDRSIENDKNAVLEERILREEIQECERPLICVFLLVVVWAKSIATEYCSIDSVLSVYPLHCWRDLVVENKASGSQSLLNRLGEII
jgi:hypothetical protein